MHYYISGFLYIRILDVQVSRENPGLDRSISSLGSLALDEGEEEHGRIPPVLTAEQAAALRYLKSFMKAVGDVNRLAILQELGREEGLSVLDLSERLLLSQPLTSWHLHILKRARLVTPTHLGRQRIYRLNQERLQEYKELFERVT